jgi:hypothetical protein
MMQLLYEYGAMEDFMIRGGKQKKHADKPAPVPLRPPRISQETTWGFARLSAAKAQIRTT